MENGFKYIPYIFASILILAILGFYNSYIYFLFRPNSFTKLHHLHAITMFLWLLLIVIQPILIKKKKLKWHKRIGKISYFIIPFVFVITLLGYQHVYQTLEEEGRSHFENLRVLFLPFLDIVPFLIFYLVAIVKKRDVAQHSRYMICSALILLGPALERLFLRFSGTTDYFFAVNIRVGAITIILTSLIVYDYRHGKQLKNNPFAISLFVFLIPAVLNLFAPTSSTWQNLANQFAIAFL